MLTEGEGEAVGVAEMEEEAGKEESFEVDTIEVVVTGTAEVDAVSPGQSTL